LIPKYKVDGTQVTFDAHPIHVGSSYPRLSHLRSSHRSTLFEVSKKPFPLGVLSYLWLVYKCTCSWGRSQCVWCRSNCPRLKRQALHGLHLHQNITTVQIQNQIGFCVCFGVGGVICVLQASEWPNMARKNWIHHVEINKIYELLSPLKPKKKGKKTQVQLWEILVYFLFLHAQEFNSQRRITQDCLDLWISPNICRLPNS